MICYETPRDQIMCFEKTNKTNFKHSCVVNSNSINFIKIYRKKTVFKKILKIT